MKTPSLLVQCFPGLLPSKATSCVPIVSERDLQLPSPAVEIIPSKVHLFFLIWLSFVYKTPKEILQMFCSCLLYCWLVFFLGLFSWVNNLISMSWSFLSQSAHPYKYAGEKVDVQGLDIFKVSSTCIFLILLIFKLASFFPLLPSSYQI